MRRGHGALFSGWGGRGEGGGGMAGRTAEPGEGGTMIFMPPPPSLLPPITPSLLPSIPPYLLPPTRKGQPGAQPDR